MDIRRAKEEILHTVRAYLAKDAKGNYEIPLLSQRPILLIGPPGIGKTAVVSQVAEELGVNLVSYSITHHTRQSAIGLPFIEHRTYGGEEVAVTGRASARASCSSMRSTASPRRWPRHCYSFCRRRSSARTRCRKGGSW